MSGYVDPYHFSDFGFSLKKSIKHATKGISKVATKVVGKQVVAEVSRATERTLTTGSPTTGIPIVLNPVGLVYGATQGDPTSLLALQAGLTAAGLPAPITGAIDTGLQIVQGLVNPPTTPGMEASIVDQTGEIATPVAPHRLGPKQKMALYGLLAVGAYFWWKHSRSRR